MTRLVKNSGFTLIELVIVILVLGVMATVAVMKLTPSIETAKFEQTKQELEQLVYAIGGRPDIYEDGARSDFGFVGDNGVMPASLDDLVQNPGGWSTWDGPYIESGPSGNDYKNDAWNSAYIYSDSTIVSTGSGMSISRIIASSGLLSNVVRGVVLDANSTAPGAIYRDSVRIDLIYPDGSGSITIAAVTPGVDGSFLFSGIPVGNHILRAIGIPDNDTVSLPVAIYPSRETRLNIIFPADLW